MISFFEFMNILNESQGSEEAQYYKPPASSRFSQSFMGSGGEALAMELIKNGRKLGDWMGQSYFLYDDRVWVVKDGQANNKGSVHEFEKNADKNLVNHLGIPELMRSIRDKKFPPQIEQERRLRMNMRGTAEEEERVWDLMNDAIRKAGISAEVDKMDHQEENLIFYGKYMDVTLFTHRNGPYSDIVRVRGTVLPKEWNDDPESWRSSPKGFEFELDGGWPFDFHPRQIAAIHDVSIEKDIWSR